MRIKYPRTFHLPQSLGITSDDKVLKSTDHFLGKEVVITEKFDGENSTLYHDYFHARSLDSRHHASRDWLAAFQATIGNDIPKGWRICGENVYAKHSIGYNDLPSYFLGFSIWDENNKCLSWDDTETYFKILSVTPVKVLWRGVFTDSIIEEIISNLDLEKQEGFVVRLAESFHYDDFSKSVAKFVRKNHVQTDTHWMQRSIIANTLK